MKPRRQLLVLAELDPGRWMGTGTCGWESPLSRRFIGQVPRHDICSQPRGLCCPWKPAASGITSRSEPRALSFPLCPFLFFFVGRPTSGQASEPFKQCPTQGKGERQCPQRELCPRGPKPLASVLRKSPHFNTC